MAEKPEPTAGHIHLFEGYNYDLEHNYASYPGQQMVSGFGIPNYEMCGNYNYNNQFMLFPQSTYMNQISSSLVNANSLNSGVPTGDTYVPNFSSLYQSEAFLPDQSGEEQPQPQQA